MTKKRITQSYIPIRELRSEDLGRALAAAYKKAFDDAYAASNDLLLTPIRVEGAK